jgi:hypothetical protein
MMAAALTSLTFEDLAIRVAPEHESPWTVEIEGKLQGGSDSTGELVIASTRCSLIVSSCATDRGSVRPWKDHLGNSLGVRVVPADEQVGWKGTTMRLVLQWLAAFDAGENKHNHPGAFRTPCLVLPDMLPPVIEAAWPLGHGAPLLLPRLRFADVLPSALNAGGVAIPDSRGRVTAELLQTVIFPESHSAEQHDELTVTGGQVKGNPGLIDQVYDYAGPLLEYAKSELHRDLPLRPVIFLNADETETIYPASGAYCPFSPDEVGAAKVDRGKPVQVVRLLSQGWFSGGIQLWGENSISLRLAIGGAIGMKWLQESGERRALDRLIDSTKVALANAPTGEDLSSRDAVLSMQLPIFEGLQDKSVRRALQLFLKTNMGKYVPQGELISLFRKQGIKVPHVFE